MWLGLGRSLHYCKQQGYTLRYSLKYKFTSNSCKRYTASSGNLLFYLYTTKQQLSTNDLDNLIKQLPTPFILLGDFNAHNILWGSNHISDRGKNVEDFIIRHDLCLYNTKSPTYLHPGTGTYTCIDLTICSPSLLLDYNWKVTEDLHSSDHFPISLENFNSEIDDAVLP